MSDVRLVTVRDPVIHWQVSFDASWSGDGDPRLTRCRWRMLDDDRVPIITGGVELDSERVDDEVAVSVYPDEIPGVPKDATFKCE